MQTSSRYTWRLLLVELVSVIVALLFLVPFYYILVNSFKSYKDILLDPSALPTELLFGNYRTAWERMHYIQSFGNSLLITVLSIAGILLISSMGAYRISRFPTRFNRFIFTLAIASMIIPFQVLMIPLVKMLQSFKLIGSPIGVILSYFGFFFAFSAFLLHGFLQSVPREVEEAGIVDGCSQTGVFFRIVAPLLRPIFATLIILHTLAIWNDFLLPYIVLTDRTYWTIPLHIYQFFGEYTKEWNYALPVLVLGITPMVVFFIFLQKHIVQGIASGAVKG